MPNRYTEWRKYLGIFARPTQDGFVGSRHFELWGGRILAALCRRRPDGAVAPAKMGILGWATIPPTCAMRRAAVAFFYSMALYYGEDNGWVREPTSAADAAANTITATPDRLGLWAALTEARRMIYLPLALFNF